MPYLSADSAELQASDTLPRTDIRHFLDFSGPREREQAEHAQSSMQEGRNPLASGTYQSGTGSLLERPFRYQRRSVGFASETDLTRPFSCVYCSASFGRKDHLTVHVRRHMGDRPFKCGLCAKDFTRMYDLQRHIRMRHL
ncbi:hypothetical protein HPB50_002180 [Hyalomma asiaticum]|uniref:Uncharacterized protein n=1 Tax=Hyalomma asiaticum TaxID=266040 RepID=A0ACB7RGW2_HYAAI|nr:hypothetical protein HPB50_002180 [Hyalomma asiaticum]